jgi:hypothetical protein
MNKEFEYRGFKFNIKVEFNTKTERRLDGETWHTIIVNCMDFDNYYVKEEVNDKLLELFIHDCERIAKKYIDEKLEGKATVNARLSKLGFK